MGVFLGGGIERHLLVIENLCAVSLQKVKLCSNTAKRYWLAMAVDVEGVGNEVGTLPINARSDTPMHFTQRPQTSASPPKCPSPPQNILPKEGREEKKFAEQNNGNSELHAALSVPDK